MTTPHNDADSSHNADLVLDPENLEDLDASASAAPELKGGGPGQTHPPQGC